MFEVSSIKTQAMPGVLGKANRTIKLMAFVLIVVSLTARYQAVILCPAVIRYP